MSTSASRLTTCSSGTRRSPSMKKNGVNCVTTKFIALRQTRTNTSTSTDLSRPKVITSRSCFASVPAMSSRSSTRTSSVRPSNARSADISSRHRITARIDLREMIQIRDSLTDEQKDPTARSRKRMKHYAEELPTKLAAWRQGFRDRFNDAKPVGGGNPTNISSHKAKFDN
jgi:hypothetical protein